MADQEQESSPNKRSINYVDERYPFAQKEHRVNKFFIMFMVSFLILGISGLFGDGPISEQTLSGDIYKIEYHQFLREDTRTGLYISLKNPPDTTVISLTNSYIKDVQIKQVTPTPESVEITDNRLHYSFVTDSGGTIAFSLQPKRSGPKELEIGVQDDFTRINQFVYF